jgi:RecA/RadA recombinase
MAPPKNKWLSKLQKLNGAVIERYNPFNHVLTTPSPSVNLTFGNTHGLPLGYALCIYGGPKQGKTVLANAITGQLHRDDPEAWVIKFDTEFREEGQLTEDIASGWGVDFDRYQGIMTNSPVDVFDQIEKDIAAQCEDGLPLKLVIIDSITGIQGRRTMDRESIAKMQIGDQALTVQEGLKQILPIQRKYRFSVILTCHVRAEMDMVEQMRGNKVKMAASFGVQHYAEYFMMVEQNKTKEGRKDIHGVEFKNEEVTDMAGRAEQEAHKIRCTMKDSSMGPKGRVGEFTLDYKRGITNVYEEIFMLAKNRGVFDRPNNTTYVLGERKWTGAPAAIEAVRTDEDLRKEILVELRKRDLRGAWAAEDAAKAAEMEPELAK